MRNITLLIATNYFHECLASDQYQLIYQDFPLPDLWLVAGQPFWVAGTSHSGAQITGIRTHKELYKGIKCLIGLFIYIFFNKIVKQDMQICTIKVLNFKTIVLLPEREKEGLQQLYSQYERHQEVKLSIIIQILPIHPRRQ